MAIEGVRNIICSSGKNQATAVGVLRFLPFTQLYLLPTWDIDTLFGVLTT